MVQSLVVGFITLFTPWMSNLGYKLWFAKKKSLLGQWMHCVVVPRQSSHTKLIPIFEIIQR